MYFDFKDSRKKGQSETRKFSLILDYDDTGGSLFET